MDKAVADALIIVILKDKVRVRFNFDVNSVRSEIKTKDSLMLYNYLLYTMEVAVFVNDANCFRCLRKPFMTSAIAL